MNNLEMILGWKMHFTRTKGWFTSLFHRSIILIWLILNFHVPQAQMMYFTMWKSFSV